MRQSQDGRMMEVADRSGTERKSRVSGSMVGLPLHKCGDSLLSMVENPVIHEEQVGR